MLHSRGRSAIDRVILIFLVGLALTGVMSGLSACGSETPTATSQPTPIPTVVAATPPTVTPLTVVSPLPTPTTPAVAPISPLSPLVVGDVIPRYTYEIVNIYPHDPEAFTQGLLFHEGILYESTGLKGFSSIRRVDLESGAVLASASLPEMYFGEGITIVGDRLYQLTWQEQTGFIYHKETFEVQQQFSYPTEGWGITFDGERLIVSDGTARLYFWDPDTLAEIGFIDAYAPMGPVVRLNELEYIEGEIFANIWQTDLIARIDPATGAVIGWIDLSGLLPPADRTPTTDVLNGIAYLPESNQLFVTGKRWPKLFEIRLLPQQ